MNNLRMEKINNQIRQELTKIINIKFSENFPFININFVYTNRDLSKAKVYINFYSENQKQLFKKFSKNFNEIQSIFAKRIHYRKTPRLEFILDSSQEKINKVTEILENIKKQ